MLSVTNKTIVLNVALLNVVMLCVLLLNVVEPSPDLVCLASKPFLWPNTKRSSLFSPHHQWQSFDRFPPEQSWGPSWSFLGRRWKQSWSCRWPGVSVIKKISSSLMTRSNKLECLNLAKTFQSGPTFAGSTRSLPKKQASERPYNWVCFGLALKL